MSMAVWNPQNHLPCWWDMMKITLSCGVHPTFFRFCLEIIPLQKKTKNPETWKHNSNSKNMKPATHQYCPQTNHICIRWNKWSTLFTSRWAKIWLCEAIRRSGSASGAPLRLRVTPGTYTIICSFSFCSWHSSVKHILFYTIINSKSYPINCLFCLLRKRWNLEVPILGLFSSPGDDRPLLDNGKTGCHVYHPARKSPFL